MNIPFLRLILSLAIILAVLGLSGCSNSREEKGEEAAATAGVVVLAVKAEPVERTEWTSTIAISGNLRTLSTVDVKPEVGGRLLSTLVQEGSGEVAGECDFQRTKHDRESRYDLIQPSAFPEIPNVRVSRQIRVS